MNKRQTPQVVGNLEKVIAKSNIHLNASKQTKSNTSDLSLKKNQNSNISVKTGNVNLAKISKDNSQNQVDDVSSENLKPIKKYTVGYEKLKIECDSADMYDSCARVAKIIMSDAPPKEYKNTKQFIRR